jgi:hypothetical protein
MFAFLCEHTKKHQRARNFELCIGQLGVGHYLASQAWGAQDTEADAVRERMHKNYNGVSAENRSRNPKTRIALPWRKCL